MEEIKEKECIFLNAIASQSTMADMVSAIARKHLQDVEA